VSDDDTIQVGDREVEDPNEDSTGTLDPSITQITVQELLRRGVPEVSDRIAEWLRGRGLDRAWLHTDLDVLDEKVMPAVDSPGSPGLDFAQLAELLAGLLATGRVIGLDVTIYDPELDADGEYLPGIVECLATALDSLPR
jgi:arginase